MKRFFAPLLTAAIFSSCGTDTPPTTDQATTSSAAAPSSPLTITTIGSPETAAMLANEKDVQVLDVRTAGEYSAGHLKRAQHLDFYAPDFAQRLQTLDPAKTYLVYCAVGGRSKEAAQQMKALGFTKVYDATEGFQALRSAGLEVE